MMVCENCGHPDVRSWDSAADSSLPSSPVYLRADLDEVEQAILRHQTYLAALEAKRRVLKMELGQIVYPILTLPPEISARIFVECLPSHGRVRPSTVTAPLLLAQICRDWRHIAISSCQLWNSVDVAFIRSSWPREEPPNDGALPLLETWFARAKGLPLSLTIRSEYYQLPQPLILFICSVAPRLRDLELNLSTRDFEFLRQNMITFSRLRRLATFVNDIFFESGDYQPFSIFQHVPSLSELRIRSPPNPTSNLPPSLTSIEMDSIPFAALMKLFHHCPRLWHLTAHVTETPWENLPIITLPHLQSLTLRGTTLEFLTLPYLTRLETDVPNAALLSFLGRTARGLKHLAIEFEWEKEDFIGCLRTVPALTSLTVDTTRYMERFAEIFKDEPAFLPHLTTLRISGADEDFDLIAFIQLLRDRRTPSLHRGRLTAAQLDLVTIFDTDKEKSEWLPLSTMLEFEKLVAQGLRFRATYKGLVHSYVWPNEDPCEVFP